METSKGQKKAEDKSYVNIYEALSAFQRELKTMPKSVNVEFKTLKGGNIKFSYTPLGEIMSTIYPLLGKCGLSVRHEISHKDGRDGVEAILTHSSYVGERCVVESGKQDEEDTSPFKENTKTIIPVQGEIRSGIVKISNGDMKEVGASITYARRYTLTMILGIASEEDLDAKMFEIRAEAAIGFAYSKAKQGIQASTCVEDLEKATKILQTDLDKLEDGKAGALGLDKEQYKELLAMAKTKSDGYEKTVV